MQKKMVIVGNGMVAGRFLDELQNQGVQGYQITVIGAEPHGSYNRIMLSSVLAGEATIESIMQKDKAWYAANDVTLVTGQKVVRIDRQQQCVETEGGLTFAYDELVLATGSRAAKIPADNQELANIYPFRTIADTQAMMETAQQARNVVVVGGGLLGLEAAYGLSQNGAKVTLVHRSGWLLNRQLDEVAGTMLKHIMENLGIHFRLSDEIARFEGQDSLTGVTFKSGEYQACDMAIIATGIKPNAEIGFEANLKGQWAVEVDDFMRTADPAISAIGECVEHRGHTFGLVDPLWRHAHSLASRFAHPAEESQWSAFENAPIATKLKVSGVQLFSAGEVMEREGLKAVIVRDDKHHVYRKLLIEDGRIKGIVLFGDVRSGAHYFDLMQANTDITAQLPQLLLGQEYIAQDVA